jgi:hypothetical protein
MSTTEHVSPFMERNYNANRDMVGAQHQLAAAYLSKHYNWDEEEALGIMKELFVPQKNGFTEAKFKVFRKNKYGDRYPDILEAREFFNLVEENNWHLSPSFVAYINTMDEQSVNSIGTEEFIEFRRLYKKKRSQVPRESELWAAYNEFQNALKIFNNAQSGGMSSSGTPLYNKSGHTTLTSTCRVVTSTANLVNERLITGNRLLLNLHKTIELFNSTLVFADRDKIKKVAKKYNMAYPTVGHVMDMVHHCSAYYFRSPSNMMVIQDYVESLNPLERMIILCTMDLRGLYVTNPVLMRQFFDEWCAIPEVPADAKAEDYPAPGNDDYKNLASTKLPKSATKAQINHLNGYHLEVEAKWSDFIEAFLKASTPPPGLFSVKDLVRESVITSDTDSSIYSVDAVVDDYVPEGQTTIPFNGVLTYFIRSIAVDQHARLSTNMNVARKYRGRLNMKNEYLFSSYVTTSMSKHYYALQLMVEGVLNNHPELELKGVHLKGIKIAQKVREFTQKLMREVLDTIYSRKTMCASTLLADVADLERELITNLKEGGWVWLKKDQIKPKEVYAKPDSSIYFYHDLWTKGFSHKYGGTDALPYKAYKVNLAVDNRTQVNALLDSLKDPVMKTGVSEMIGGGTSLSSLYVPTDVIQKIGGIPVEFRDFIDIRGVISQNLRSVYAILESLGLFIVNRKISRLVSDEH